MRLQTNQISLLILMIAALSSYPLKAEQAQDFLSQFSAQAKTDTASFTGFDAGRGEQFFKARHGGDWSCSSCHTDNPLMPGKHIVTEKEIQPMAPAANAERFTSGAKVDKWFKRNCKDVLSRECTAQEKGDVLSYLLSLGH
ncbi:DUF1924 domain-containing protein [Methylomonas sp. AM2-LC]|uniref:DUF1924 domain-containing protein n=1 Tax=Methylomonas sp. AM2-LC TaxID=3153301 RepID=UPI003267C1D3